MEDRRFLAGNDYGDDGAGALVYLAFLFAIVVGFIILVCVLGGVIGGFYAIKSYVLAFKHNVVDSNKMIPVSQV